MIDNFEKEYNEVLNDIILHDNIGSMLIIH